MNSTTRVCIGACIYRYRRLKEKYKGGGGEGSKYECSSLRECASDRPRAQFLSSSSPVRIFRTRV